jgi:hypothetical protein
MIELFAKQFHDTASFYTLSLSFNSSNQEVKNKTLLYSGIRCNLIERSQSMRFEGIQGEDEYFQNGWRCDVEPQYNGANRGDIVEANGQEYVIKKKVVDTDFQGNDFCIKYHLEEKE